MTTTPADELRTAADALRAVDAADPFWTALAGWLEVHAGDLKRGGNRVGSCDSPGDTMHALKVARAYLGTTEQVTA